MRISGAFPSTYLKAADIPEGRFIPVTMKEVVHEDVGGDGKPEDHKPVLYFDGKQKGLVLNRTNADAIASVFGDETADWTGHQIQLYASKVQFNGQLVPCIRVQASRQTPATAAAAPSRQQTVNVGAAVRQAVAERPAPEQPFANEEQQFKEDDIPF